MSKYVIDESTLKNLADATRKATGKNRTYTPGEMTAAIGSMPDSIVDRFCPDFSESGSVVRCTPVSGYPLEVVSQIVPKQDGTGDPSPDNVRPIGGYSAVELTQNGRNLFGGDALADVIVSKDKGGGVTKDEVNKTVTFNLAYCDRTGHLYNRFKENTQYTIILYGYNTKDAGVVNMRVQYTDETNESFTFKDQSTGDKLDANVEGYAVIRTNAKKTMWRLTLQYTGSPTVLYYDKCGIFEGDISIEEFEAYKGEIFTIDLGQTVYGGSLNWNTGVLTIGYANLRLDRKLRWATLGGSNETTRPIGLDGDASGIARKNTALCTHFVRGTQDGTVGQFWISLDASAVYNVRFMVPKTIATTLEEWYAYLDTNEVMLCYEMVEPIIIQLAPQAILALSGVNTLYSDTGDTTVTGKADPITVIEYLQAQLGAAAVATE